MPSIATKYLGLQLPSPVVVSSCSLTGTINGLRRAADSGAGAVVVKSLFEEQIDAEYARDRDAVDLSQHPEASEYVEAMTKHLGPDSYLDLLREAKKELDIPVIASVNCVTPSWWTRYGAQIQTTGIDALELNIALMPRQGESDDEIENQYAEIVRTVAAEVSIPISAKIGPYFTSMPRMVRRMRESGAAGLVLFNRFYHVDINIDSEELTSGYQLSSPEEIATTLRWISILAENCPCELAASTGVYTGDDAIKMLLAGANAVFVCSALYKHGYGRIAEINDRILEWMSSQSYETVADFRAKLSQSRSNSPERYERLQYIKALTGVS